MAEDRGWPLVQMTDSAESDEAIMKMIGVNLVYTVDPSGLVNTVFLQTRYVAP